MFKKTAIIAGLGLAISGAAQAQETPQEAIVTGDRFVDTYRWELNADYTHGEWSANGFDDTETDQFSVGGSFYFQPVDTTKGPRAEAAFLDHASDVTLGYTYSEVDDNGIDIDGDKYNVSGRYVTQGGFIFEAGYERDEPIEAEIDIFRLSAGYYLTENTSLIVDYVDADADEGGDTDGWNARLEHMWHMGDNGGGIKLEGNYGFINVDDGDDIDLYGLEAIWYINQDIGVGVAYENTDFGQLESEDYRLFAEWFITRHLAVNVGYDHQEPDDFDDGAFLERLNDLDLEYDAFTIGGTYRF